MGFTQLAAPGIDNIGGAGIAGSSMRILAGGVVGGTASVLAGGQFNDGFKNGVLSRGLNHELPHSVGTNTGQFDYDEGGINKQGYNNAMRGRPNPFEGLTKYGHYAGSGFFGQEFHPNPAYSPYQPIDGVDAAARTHDIQYFVQSIEWRKHNLYSTIEPQSRIDQHFLDEINSLSLTFGSHAYMYRIGANLIFPRNAHTGSLGISPYAP